MLLKKAWDLSRKCNLKVNVVIYDDEKNIMQEFKSCSNLNSEAIALHKQRNSHLKIKKEHRAYHNRKRLPKRNWIEEVEMVDVLQG